MGIPPQPVYRKWLGYVYRYVWPRKTVRAPELTSPAPDTTGTLPSDMAVRSTHPDPVGQPKVKYGDPCTRSAEQASSQGAGDSTFSFSDISMTCVSDSVGCSADTSLDLLNTAFEDARLAAADAALPNIPQALSSLERVTVYADLVSLPLSKAAAIGHLFVTGGGT